MQTSPDYCTVNIVCMCVYDLQPHNTTKQQQKGASISSWGGSPMVFNKQLQMLDQSFLNHSSELMLRNKCSHVMLSTLTNYAWLILLQFIRTFHINLCSRLPTKFAFSASLTVAVIFASRKD